VALFQYRRSSRQAALAEELFYAMKSLDVDVARVEKQLADAGSPQADTYTAQHRQRREAMEARYNEFLSALGVYDNKLSEQDRLILRVARIFGECELAMPEDFKRQVEGYIDKWKSSGRFARAVARAGANGYTTPIVRELLKHNLPPQFFYLALQESDFDEYVSGPMTYKGIAKGMWQFIPETALKYGLRLGPLVDAPRPDPADERHQWQKATAAAARYLKDIYATDAQASGLLVMASYNWGEDKVVRLLRSMPANPRERNFWKVLTEHRARVPDQTYDYVFYIVAAAVIGENPRLFGFPFDNPMSTAELR
jgi:membrane-bound lytic murein transglycosylase D